MLTKLRRTGNSIGLIIPAAVLRELGIAAGTPVDVQVEEGKLVATPNRRPREGWAEATNASGPSR